MTVTEGAEKLYPGVMERREHQGDGKGSGKRGQGHAWEQGTMDKCEHGTELQEEQVRARGQGGSQNKRSRSACLPTPISTHAKGELGSSPSVSP